MTDESSFVEERLPAITQDHGNSLHGTETPPRQTSFSEVGTPISGTNDRMRRRLLNNSNNNGRHSMIDHDDLSGLIVQTTSFDECHTKNKDHLLLRALASDLKRHLDKTIFDLRDQSRRDFENGMLKHLGHAQGGHVIIRNGTCLFLSSHKLTP